MLWARGIRADVSLLLAEGHAHARVYPIGMVWVEAGFVRRRISDKIHTDAVVMHAVVATVIAGGDYLKDVLGKIRDGS